MVHKLLLIFETKPVGPGFQKKSEQMRGHHVIVRR